MIHAFHFFFFIFRDLFFSLLDFHVCHNHHSKVRRDYIHRNKIISKEIAHLDHIVSIEEEEEEVVIKKDDNCAKN